MLLPDQPGRVLWRCRFLGERSIKVVSQGHDFGLPPLLPNCARSVPKNSADINDIPRK